MTTGKGRRVLALAAGALVFYACMAIVSVAIDRAASPGSFIGLSASSASYIGAWFVGAALSSALAVEAARRAAPDFDRIVLIVLSVAPIGLLAIATIVWASGLSSRTITALMCAFVGTAIGLGRTFRDLTRP